MIDIILMCAPDVAPQTIEKIIQVESAGDPLALNVNKLKGKQPKANTVAEAVQIAQSYIAKGHTVDMGLMQINSANLNYLGIDNLEELFNPCVNIAAGADILTQNYIRAAKKHGDGQVALQAALSAYNTGNFESGHKNGYVAKFYAKTDKNTNKPQQFIAQTTPNNSNIEAMRSPTSIGWKPNYKELEDMENQDNNQELEDMETPTKEELAAIDPLLYKLQIMANSTAVGTMEFDPEEAARMGAFEEDALTEEEAIASQVDAEVI